MNKTNISVVASVYNEEKNIIALLESVRQLAAEIIVIDNFSTDNTVKIARKYTDKVFSRPNLKMLNKNKNFGFEKAQGEWILNLDGDERVSPDLAKEIEKVINNETMKQLNNEINGYFISRKNIIFKKWIKHGLWWPDYQLRLFRKGKGKFPCLHVHEKIKVDGPTDSLKNPLIHYNYLTVSQYLQKLDRIYTEDEAESFIRSGKKITWSDSLRLPINDFLSVFFARKGYQDGLHGLVLALLQSFYALVVFAKVWEKEGFWEYQPDNFSHEFGQELKKAKKDFLFWLSQEKNLINRLFHKIKSPV